MLMCFPSKKKKESKEISQVFTKLYKVDKLSENRYDWVHYFHVISQCDRC